MPGDFTDLVAWQEAVGLAADVAGIVRRLEGPGALDVASQMRRAAESVPSNIAEGYGRGRGRDFARFCRIAAASAAEWRAISGSPPPRAGCAPKSRSPSSAAAAASAPWFVASP
jgi:hypothetical protein